MSKEEYDKIMLGTHEQRTKGLKKQAQEVIDQTYQMGYKAGYEACKEPKDALIEKGRNEAWETIIKILEKPWPERRKVLKSECYVLYDMVSSISASEAIEKLRAYEDQKKQEEDSEIQVGDEVYFHDPTATRIVTCIFEINEVTKAAQIASNGKWAVNDIRDLHKTGRHFDEIENVLKNLN